MNWPGEMFCTGPVPTYIAEITRPFDVVGVMSGMCVVGLTSVLPSPCASTSNGEVAAPEMSRRMNLSSGLCGEPTVVVTFSVAPVVALAA